MIILKMKNYSYNTYLVYPAMDIQDELKNKNKIGGNVIMKKLFKVLKGILIVGVLSLIFIKPLTLGLMNIVDEVGNMTGWNVVTYIDLLNEIYYW